MNYSKTQKLTHMNGFTQQRCLMHELFRNTTNIHAGPTQTPLCSLWRGFHEVEDSDFGAELSCFLSASESSWSTSNDNKVILVFFSICNEKWLSIIDNWFSLLRNFVWLKYEATINKPQRWLSNLLVTPQMEVKLLSQVIRQVDFFGLNSTCK